jgi:uncharacterized protein YqcC (DUF446 family)
MPTHDTVQRTLDAIESEMKRIGMWQADPLAPGKFDDMGPFGANTMSFEQWLQFVFVPNVRAIVAERGEFPSQSQVSQKAYREWKMWGDMPDVDTLLELLRKFDSLFNRDE